MLVVLSVTSDSLNLFFDNYISDYHFKGRGAFSQNYFYAFTYLLVAVIMALASNFDFTTVAPLTVVLLLLSGVISAIDTLPYYKALELDDSTNLGIFIQLAPVLYLIFGWLFLGETMSISQLVSFFIIVSAPFLIINSARKRSRGIRLKAALYAFLYVLMSVASSLIFAQQLGAGADFPTFLALTSIVLLGRSVGTLAIFVFQPKRRKRFFQVVRSSKNKVFYPMAFNSILDVMSTVTYRAALIAAPSVALASAACDASQPIVIFFMGIILTLIWPKFGREKLDRKTVRVHVIATILVVIGIALLQS